MEAEFSECPFCGIYLLFTEIERHVEDHLTEDEQAKDINLARHLASGSESSEKGNWLKGNETFNTYHISDKTSRNQNVQIPESIFDILDDGQLAEEVSILTHCQVKSDYYRVEEGLMTLLKRCLEEENDNTHTVVSGHIDHFQSIYSEDKGWGCGWRNIQMLSSHILTKNSHARKILFGGSGFVPDIVSLQRWLEIAWRRGFDVMGANAFNFNIYGSRKWIGATECATLLRSFGLRARIVDFGCEAVKNRIHSSDAMRQTVHRNAKDILHENNVTGPLDKYIYLNIECDGCRAFPLRGTVFMSTGKNDFHLCASCMATGKYKYSEFVESNSRYRNSSKKCNQVNVVRKCDNHQVLLDWVWNYFTGDKCSHSNSEPKNSKGNVFTSQKTPLYFQHDGHSRTIIGIQRRQKSKGKPHEDAILLILDPAQNTKELAMALRGNAGWQKLVKRGVHTLRKSEYQLCYVDPGIAYGEELERLKLLESEAHYY